MSRLCVVTGASRGIGRSVAYLMASEGYEVVATGRDETALAQTVELAPRDIRSAFLDVTDRAAITAFFRDLPVDILVNNAGVGFSAPLRRTELADWEFVMRVNATGPFLCTRAVLPGMLERAWGRVITVASVESHIGSPYLSAYAASKHAVLGFSKAVAAEVRDSGVTVNTVCPAYVDTPMTDSSVERITSLTGMDTVAARERLANMTPLGRLLDPSEVAHAVMFLASEQAGSINGRSLVMDGGGVSNG